MKERLYIVLCVSEPHAIWCGEKWRTLDSLDNPNLGAYKAAAIPSSTACAVRNETLKYYPTKAKPEIVILEASETA